MWSLILSCYFFGVLYIQVVPWQIGKFNLRRKPLLESKRPPEGVQTKTSHYRPTFTVEITGKLFALRTDKLACFCLFLCCNMLRNKRKKWISGPKFPVYTMGKGKRMKKVVKTLTNTAGTAGPPAPSSSTSMDVHDRPGCPLNSTAEQPAQNNSGATSEPGFAGLCCWLIWNLRW